MMAVLTNYMAASNEPSGTYFMTREAMFLNGMILWQMKLYVYTILPNNKLNYSKITQNKYLKVYQNKMNQGSRICYCTTRWARWILRFIHN